MVTSIEFKKLSQQGLFSKDVNDLPELPQYMRQLM